MIKKDTIELRKKICDLAISKCGCKYVHGMHGPNTFDCAGLVWYVYHEVFNINIYEHGFGLSTTTRIMTSEYGKFSYNRNLKLIREGDILFFHRQSLNDNIPLVDNKYPGHVAIYLGDNNFIHATTISKKVMISEIDENWYNIFVGSKDIINDPKVLKKEMR